MNKLHVYEWECRSYGGRKRATSMTNAMKAIAKEMATIWSKDATTTAYMPSIRIQRIENPTR